MPTQEWSGTTDTTFTVPDGVTEVEITCDGQDGETNTFNNFTAQGGAGGTASATLPAAGGTTLYIKIDTGVVSGGVGGESDGSSDDGGNGGGGAFVGTSNSIGDALCIAGGGGGGAGLGDSTSAAVDGNDGGGPNYDGQNDSQDGSQTSGGTGSSTIYDAPGEDGGHGQGGDGGQNTSQGLLGGGAGGGGWYGGGGGGGGESFTQGGGGASGYASGSLSNVSGSVGGSNNSSGRVVLSYTVPLDPPTLSLAGHDATSVSLSWGAVDRADDYQVYRSTAPGVTTGDTKVYDGASTSYTDTGLTDATTYHYRVRANDADGSESDLSNEVTQQTNLRATTPTLDAATEDEVALSWSKTDANTGGEFEVFRSEASGTLGTRIADNLSPTATSYTDTGREDGERYHYTLRRVVNGLTADGSQRAATTVLPAPSGLSLDASTQREVTLSWAVNDDSPDGDIEVYRSTDGSLGPVVATLGDDATSYTDTSLFDGEQYYYTVRRNTDHASGDAAQQATTTVLPAPSGLEASNIDATSATLTWVDNANNGTVRIETRRSSEASYSTEATGIALNTETYDLGGLLTGEEYDARVVAVTEHTGTIDS